MHTVFKQCWIPPVLLKGRPFHHNWPTDSFWPPARALVLMLMFQSSVFHAGYFLQTWQHRICTQIGVLPLREILPGITGGVIKNPSCTHKVPRGTVIHQSTVHLFVGNQHIVLSLLCRWYSALIGLPSGGCFSLMHIWARMNYHHFQLNILKTDPSINLARILIQSNTILEKEWALWSMFIAFQCSSTCYFCFLCSTNVICKF